MGVAGTEEESLLGDLYADQGLIPEAGAAYRKVLAASPELGERKLLQYAQVLIAGGQLASAENVLGSLQTDKTQENQMEILQTKADLYAAEQRWPEAMNEIDTLLNLSPLNGRALLSQGRAFASQGDVPRATLSFEAAFRIASTQYTASLELANIELKNRHYSKSVEYLESALKIEKTDAVEDFLARVKTLADKTG
jgi:tetratricopeptide (TPR) repeat protein